MNTLLAGGVLTEPLCACEPAGILANRTKNQRVCSVCCRTTRNRCGRRRSRRWRTTAVWHCIDADDCKWCCSSWYRGDRHRCRCVWIDQVHQTFRRQPERCAHASWKRSHQGIESVSNKQRSIRKGSGATGDGYLWSCMSMALVVALVVVVGLPCYRLTDDARVVHRSNATCLVAWLWHW
jgi:hypothetical protein